MPTNPYSQHTREQLYAAAQRRAAKLLDGPHSDTGHLLLALAMELHDSRMATRGPGGDLKGAGTLIDAYGPRLELLLRNARHEVLLDAADVVLGAKARAWLNPGYYEGSPVQRGMASDAGLLEVLAELELLRKR